MTRKLKGLGVALIALCALGALTAVSASAAGELFRAEKETAIITGTNVGNHVFSTPGGLKVTCEEGTFRGTSKADVAGGTTTKTMTLHPTYNKCSDNIFGAASPVDTTGCNYVFTSETKATANGEKHIPASIECTEGYKIAVTAAGCTLTFGAQNTLDGVALKNEGAGTTRDILATATVAGVTYSKDEKGFCGLISGTVGTYNGVVTLKGFEDKGVSGPIDEVTGAAPGTDATTIYTEGAQIGIFWE
jgi:hypothetical protein